MHGPLNVSLEFWSIERIYEFHMNFRTSKNYFHEIF